MTSSQTIAAAFIALVLTACSGAPAKQAPVVGDLDIKPMPAGAGAVPSAMPAPSARAEGEPTTGKCEADEGNVAPPLDLPGATLRKGKVTVVYYWATWCSPCQKAFPKYEALYQKHKSQGFDLIAVSVDDEKDEVGAFAKRFGAHFSVAWDDGHKAAACWKINSMPTAIVVDRDGIVRHVHAGFHDGDEAVLEREVEALL